MDFMEKIKRYGKEFTASQRRLAEYILNNIEEVAFMSASVLGKKSKVSESTVIRFSQLLGYKGFPELKESIREMVLRRLDTSKRLSSYLEENDDEHILYRTLKKDISVMELAIEEISVEEFDAVVDALVDAKRVFVIAHRSAYSLGYLLTFYLRWLGIPVFMLKGKDSSYELLSSSKLSDIVMGITFPRYSSETVELFRFAVGAGLKTVAITDDYFSPIAGDATYVLTVPTDFVSFVDSFTTPLSLINALIVSLTMKKPKLARKRLKLLEELWKKEHVYWKEEEEEK